MTRLPWFVPAALALATAACASTGGGGASPQPAADDKPVLGGQLYGEFPKWDVVQPYVHNYHPHFSVRAPYAVAWIRK